MLSHDKQNRADFVVVSVENQHSRNQKPRMVLEEFTSRSGGSC